MVEQITLDSPRTLRVREVNLPEVPGEAVVQVAYAGICASDLDRVYGAGPYQYPLVLGHEISGTVTEVVGDPGSSLVNKNCVVVPLIPCDVCASCERNSPWLCLNYDYLGSRRDGGFSKFISVPVSAIRPIGHNLDLQTAVLAEPLAVSFHAVAKGQPIVEKSVAVIGTGTLANMIAWICGQMGARRSTLISRSPQKTSFLKTQIPGLGDQKPGTKYRVVGSLAANSTQVVFEAADGASGLLKAIEIASPGGTIVMVGNASSDLILPQQLHSAILRKELTLVGSWNSDFATPPNDDWASSIKALEEHTDFFSRLVSNVFEWKSYQEAFALCSDRNTPSLKVAMNFRAD